MNGENDSLERKIQLKNVFMRTHPLIFSVSMLVISLLPLSARAELRLYSGNLEVVKTSGKACAGVRGQHRIDLVISQDDQQGTFSGIMGGEDVIVGRLSGTFMENLALRYPYSDQALAEGHFLKLSISGSKLNGELRDKHIEATADECNFDLARLDLIQSERDDAAVTVFQKLSIQYDAQLARSVAISSLRHGDNAVAVQNYEKALVLADQAYPPGSSKRMPYLTGLANSYIRLGRFTDFINLYGDRYPEIKDQAIQTIFNGHLVRSQLHLGHVAMGREDYSTALEYFKKALAVNHNNKNTIAAIMSAYVRNGQHDQAIAFLEQTEKKLESEPDRRDVRDAIALIQYQKAIKEDKAGQYAAAQASLAQAIRLDPDTVQYQIVQARWRHKSGRYHEADSILKKALEHFKDVAVRAEINTAREKLRITEMILNKIRRSGG